VDAIIKLGEDKFEKSHYNTFLTLMNAIFNALSPDSKNRLILLRKIIKICKHENKEYLLAPYLSNIDDLLNTAVYSLEDQCEIYEEFLSIIDNTIQKDDDYSLILKYIE
jgi:UV DNA damage repair endonuclease